MNKYRKRQRNIYSPDLKEPFRISRSKIDLFLQCPRCFYLDRRIGLARPGMPGWALNSAVDHLLKKEFDLLRKNGESHALMTEYGVDAVPFKHKDLPAWRDDYYKYLGASVFHKKSNLEICGIIDDIWVNQKTKELYIVDYKATSTSREISLDDEYKQGYKKQMEIYQWIFRQMGFNISNTGYFLFANAGKNRDKFDGKLEFEASILSYNGDDSWIDSCIMDLKKCLDSDVVPHAGEGCEHCMREGLIKKEGGGHWQKAFDL